MMQFSHVNLRVSQLERAVAFYEKQFGLKLCRRLEADGCKMAWLRDAATPGFFLELSEGNVVRGNNHIAFITDERDKWYLQHQRERLIDREIRELGIYFMRDMDGNSIEVMPQTAVAALGGEGAAVSC